MFSDLVQGGRQILLQSANINWACFSGSMKSVSVCAEIREWVETYCSTSSAWSAHTSSMSIADISCSN